MSGNGDTAGPADTESRQAFHELLHTLAQVDRTYLSGFGMDTAEAVAEGHRMLMHLVGAGLDMFFESSGDDPVFRRAHWSGRKFWGDNADCIYYVAQIDPNRTYRIRGNLAGAAYTSFTVDGGGIDERYPPARVVSSLHDGQFTSDADGNYEIVVSAESHEGNWLPLEPDAAAIGTRHYYELADAVAADSLLHIPLSIELFAGDPRPQPRPLEQTVARDLRRLSTFINGLTIGRTPPPASPDRPPPPPPNTFPPPVGWSAERGYGAVDIVNMIARYQLASDEALVIDGRFPTCRFASIALWNRYLQTLDYVHHQVSRNRSQTELHPDGTFTVVVAERDPEVPNWIETTGVNAGTVFVRYILPEDEPEPLRTRVVPVASLRP